MGCFLGVALVPAQETLFLAPALDGLWVGSDGARIHIQEGRRVYRIDPGGDALRALRSPHLLPPGTRLFDLDGASLHCGTDGVSGSAFRRSFARPWVEPFGLPHEGAPRRLPLLSTAGVAIVPAAEGLRLVPRAGEEPETVLPGAIERSFDPGWGFGNELALSSTIPWVHPVRSAGGTRLLVATDRMAALHELDGRRSALSREHMDAREGILGFPWSVAPLVVDLTGDGTDEVVLFDPSAGTAAIWRGSAADGAKPDRLIVAGRPIVAAFAGDLDADGRPDLALVVEAATTLLGQFETLTSGMLPSEVRVWSGSSEGEMGLVRSPRRQRVSLGFRVIIENERRRGRFTDQLTLASGPEVRIVRTDGSIIRRAFGEEPITSEAPVLPAGQPRDPFPRTRDAEGQALFIWDEARGSRVVRW